MNKHLITLKRKSIKTKKGAKNSRLQMSYIIPSYFMILNTVRKAIKLPMISKMLEIEVNKKES